MAAVGPPGATSLTGTSAHQSPQLEVRSVSVAFARPGQRRETKEAVAEVSLGIPPGEILSIVGPSGCGKSTILNAIAGLVPISAGSITLDGKQISGPGRERSMVFQQASLLPWRTVLRNVTYGLEVRGTRRSEAEPIAREFIRLVGLQHVEDAYPHQLSGGMQQRVNLARALATEPEVILLDEPFAALDAQTREFMQLELLRILAQAGRTALFVTHQIDEAIYLADRVAVFTRSPGRIRDMVPIDLPRPRPLELKQAPEFIEYEKRIWTQMVEEVRLSGLFGPVAQNVVLEECL